MGPRTARRAAATRPLPALSEYLHVVVPHLADTLLCAKARERLQRVARRVPLSDLAGFECRLGEAAGWVDLIVRLPRTVVLPLAHATDPLWQRIRKLSKRLRERAAPHFDSVNVMGLEFDVPRSPTTVPPPALFFELDVASRCGAPRLIALSGELQGVSVAPALASTLRRCVDALPAPAAPFQLGAMLSRSGHAVRLVVSDIPSKRVPRYLRDAGWTGDARIIADVIGALSACVETFAVSMDVAQALHPRIGIECFVAPGRPYVQRWQRLLERLQELRLCTPAEARDLLAWGGVSQEATCRGSWPRHLRWGDRLLASCASSVIARTLGHVKLVIQPGLPIEAKAYLGFAHYWLDRRADPASWLVAA